MSKGFISFLVALAILVAFYAAFGPDRSKKTESMRSVRTPQPDDGFFEKYIRPTIHNFLPQSPKAFIDYASTNGNIKALLARSGNPWKINAEEYIALRVLSAIAGAGFVIFLVILHYISISYIFAMIIGLAIGQAAPKFLLNNEWTKRKRAIGRGLPEALDLLRICMNSGKNFSGSLKDTVNILPAGVIKEELGRVIAEQNIGKSIAASLESFSVRCPTDEVEAFVRTISQAESLGTDISSTLARQAEETRAAYERTIEIKTQKLQSTLFIPIIALFLPVLMLLLFAPSLSSLTSSL